MDRKKQLINVVVIFTKTMTFVLGVILLLVILGACGSRDIMQTKEPVEPKPKPDVLDGSWYYYNLHEYAGIIIHINNENTISYIYIRNLA